MSDEFGEAHPDKGTMPGPCPSLPEVRSAAAGCRACELWERATQTVFGEGPTPADVMRVGEQPGHEEDLAGQPFVGPAGRLLDKALEAAGRKSQVIGVNALPEAVTAIKQGKMLETADFDAFKIAAVATEAALRHLRGETIPAEILLPVQVVDASNYGPFDKPIEAREAPAWETVIGAR